ncbi:MAG: hypothetical protein L0338_32915 [Acidobacteria bacterium]|nr:hypothetical protein [Acidobacteriota bacterium]
MKEGNDKKIRELVRRAIPPVKDTELQRDLWPQMLKKLDEPTGVRVPWFDWVLLGLVVVFFGRFPKLILVLLYHL